MEIKVLFDNEARQALYKGVQEITKAVASTLGPLGHTVIIDKAYGIPHVTKDGVTVARAFDTNDPIASMGATLVKIVAAKTCDEAGDGTTTATVLTESLLRHGIEKLPMVKNPQEFKRGMEHACEKAVELFNFLAKEIDPNEWNRLKEVATISANGDEAIGDIITQAISQVGNDGVITVEEGSSNSNGMSIDVTTGFQWEKGLVNPYFVTDPERIECEMTNPYVLVVGQKINYPNEIVSVLQTVHTAQRALVIIAPDMSNDCMGWLVKNVQNGVRVVFAKAPSFGQIQKDMIQDLAIKLGAKNVCQDSGYTLDQLGTDWLGECDKIIISTNRTIIVGGKGKPEEIEARVKAIKSQIEESSNAFDKEKYRDRLSKLTGGAATIHVGATSEVELKERKDRVDDAIAATRAALDEGYVPGGGSIQYLASKLLFKEIETSYDKPNYRFGMEVVAEALKEPLRQLCKNAGINPDKAEAMMDVRDEKLEWMKGIDPMTGQLVDFFEKGVIDPVKVSRLALQNAVSVAIQFLNTSCVMAQPEKDTK